MAFLDDLFIRLTSRKVGQDRFGNTYWEARSRRDVYGRDGRIFEAMREAGLELAEVQG